MKQKSHSMLPSAQSIIIELGCLDICNRNMRKFVVKYNQMECSHPVLGIKCTILDCWLFDCVARFRRLSKFLSIFFLVQKLIL